MTQLCFILEAFVCIEEDSIFPPLIHVFLLGQQLPLPFYTGDRVKIVLLRGGVTGASLVIVVLVLAPAYHAVHGGITYILTSLLTPSISLLM